MSIEVTKEKIDEDFRLIQERYSDTDINTSLLKSIQKLNTLVNNCFWKPSSNDTTKIEKQISVIRKKVSKADKNFPFQKDLVTLVLDLNNEFEIKHFLNAKDPLSDAGYNYRLIIHLIEQIEKYLLEKFNNDKTSNFNDLQTLLSNIKRFREEIDKRFKDYYSLKETTMLKEYIIKDIEKSFLKTYKDDIKLHRALAHLVHIVTKFFKISYTNTAENIFSEKSISKAKLQHSCDKISQELSIMKPSNKKQLQQLIDNFNSELNKSK